MMTPQRICIEALREKYCVAGESEAIDVQRRVARALASVEQDPARWEPVFLDAQIRGVVMGGRINSSAGTAARIDVDQLFRATGRRCDLAQRRGRQTRHLRGAAGSHRDHAARRRRWLRLLPTATTRCVRHDDAIGSERAGFIHARVRSIVRDRRIGRCAPRCADGHAAHRSS